MARIIEICGAPGVGKSTIFQEIENRRKRKLPWSTATNFLPQLPENYLDFGKRVAKDVKNGRHYVNRTSKVQESYYSYARRIYHTLKDGKNHVDDVALKSAGDRFVLQNPEYVEACWNNIFHRQRKSSNGLDIRFEKAEFIYKVIKKIQVLKENKTDKTIIIDEGLVNLIDRALYQSENLKDEKEEIYRLLEIMPLPDALVYIETDIRENAKRLTSRKDVRDMHKQLSIDELIDVTLACRERLTTAINFLESKGMPVLYLDSNCPAEQNAEKIIDFTINLEQGNTSISFKKLHLTVK